jgi:YbgC/YbaW family acyl-CoA thioester hydrolase
MFEVRLQTYWSDSDSARIVFYAHYFRFVEEAEEELFRAAGVDRVALLRENHIWMPHMETFSKFIRPIPVGAAIRVRLHPHLKGEETVRYDFQFLDDTIDEKIAEGYVTVACVDTTHFKATPIPEAIRNAIIAAIP